ncbi:MAG TPA: hypothetical protein PKA11_07485, partial [Accumulibacter sp.]|nr:hypothetical protein [Accumulibacter sp.]
MMNRQPQQVGGHPLQHSGQPELFGPFLFDVKQALLRKLEQLAQGVTGIAGAQRRCNGGMFRWFVGQRRQFAAQRTQLVQYRRQLSAGRSEQVLLAGVLADGQQGAEVVEMPAAQRRQLAERSMRFAGGRRVRQGVAVEKSKERALRRRVGQGRFAARRLRAERGDRPGNDPFSTRWRHRPQRTGRRCALAGKCLRKEN